MLDEIVANSPPNSSWWIKGDACDVVSGLGESVKGVWTGDVELMMQSYNCCTRSILIERVQS